MRRPCKKHELSGNRLRDRFPTSVGPYDSMTQHIREAVHFVFLDSVLFGLVPLGVACIRRRSRQSTSPSPPITKEASGVATGKNAIPSAFVSTV